MLVVLVLSAAIYVVLHYSHLRYINSIVSRLVECPSGEGLFQVRVLCVLNFLGALTADESHQFNEILAVKGQTRRITQGRCERDEV